MGGFLACILAGAAMSIQGVMNTRLSEHIGTMETNAFVQCVAAVLSLLVLVFWRTGSFAALGAAPKYCWFGGVLALAITVTVMLGMGKLGPTLAVAVILIAQLSAAAAIDAFERAGMTGGRIEHAQLVAGVDIPRMARLGIVASIQTVACEAKVVSFNAQVMAARAGQHGREFAVVANVLSGITNEIDGLSLLAVSLAGRSRSGS